jgi:hypothetical protein
MGFGKQHTGLYHRPRGLLRAQYDVDARIREPYPGYKLINNVDNTENSLLPE